jgi:hypothetical protein
MVFVLLVTAFSQLFPKWAEQVLTQFPKAYEALKMQWFNELPRNTNRVINIFNNTTQVTLRTWQHSKQL